MTEIEIMRAKLKAMATYQPALAPVLNLLDKQLRNYARETDEGKAALKPEIRKSIAQIERAR
jgi:hypothetical protein